MGNKANEDEIAYMMGGRKKDVEPPNLDCSLLDVSDLVLDAVKERLKRKRGKNRLKEIDEQMMRLAQEKQEIEESQMFCGDWRVRLDNRIEEAIISLENGKIEEQI